MNVGVARYTVGVVSLLIVVGSMAVAAAAVRRRYLPEFEGAMARLAESVIGLALLIGLLELLGTLGLFRLIPIVVGSVVVAAVISYALEGGRPTAARVSGTWTTRRFQCAVAIAAIAAVVAEWSSPTLQAYDLGIHVVDSVWYHLPWAASFAQTGHITPLRFTDVEFLTAFYPANAELLHGLGIVLLARDTLSPALNFLWLGLSFLAAYCIGRPRGRGWLTLTAVALAMAMPMIDFSQPGGADNDVLGVFFFLASVALLLSGEERRGAYVLAAVAAGLAAAVKLTFLVPVLALTVGVLVIAPRRARLRAAALWLGPGFLAGGFWYVRNLIAVGDPLPWTSLGILPTPAPPLEAHKTFAIVHYLTNGSILRRFLEPALSGGLGRWWVVVVTATILGPLACLLPGSGRMLRMLGLVALASLIAYLFTPNSAMGPPGDPVGMTFNVRYVIPALTLALALLPLAPVFAGERRGSLLVLGFAAMFVATIAEPALWPPRHRTAAIAIGVIVLVIGAAIATLLSRPRRPSTVRPRAGARPRLGPRPRLGRRPRLGPGWLASQARGGGRRGVPRAVVAALLLVIGVAVAGYPWQRHYLRERYAYKPGVSYLGPVWAYFRTVHHARVGLAGSYGGYFGYPLLGVDDSNRVQYVAHRGPHGSFTPITSCREWRTTVDAGHFRYLVTTPTREFWHPRSLFPAPETAWTASDGAAHVVLRRRAFGQPIVVYELRASLDPATCPQA